MPTTDIGQPSPRRRASSKPQCRQRGNGRIEVKVDEASGKVVNKEDDDSDNADNSGSSGDSDSGNGDSAGSAGNAGTSDSDGSQSGMDDELAETGPETAGLYGGIVPLALAVGAGLMVVRHFFVANYGSPPCLSARSRTFAETRGTI